MSPRTGRPKIENPNSKNLTVRISKDLDERLTTYCNNENITKGEVVRQGIEKILSEKEK